MRIAGLGFRSAASLASLTDALDRAGPADALATSTAKAQAPVIVALARARGLPLIGVKVAGIATPTQSARVIAMLGTGSLAEAAALAALGPGRQHLPRQNNQPHGRRSLWYAVQFKV